MVLCVLWTVLSVLLISSVELSTARCPHRCHCIRTIVRCRFLNLETIPDAPVDTTILDLRHNKIKRIPRGSLPHLPQLNTLYLDHNELEELNEGSFEGIPELRYLYLYKNRIRKIDPKAFYNVPKLEQLFLHRNALSRFPKDIFANNKQLRRLRLDSNALVCDCDMMWLKDMLTEKTWSTQAAAVTCMYPSRLQGRSLMSIPMEEFNCEKPRITLQPRSVDVSFGNTAYFTCRAEGTPDPEITWLHNDNVIKPEDEERFRLLRDGTLMIESAQDTDQGSYECIARNAAGAVKAGKAELRYFRNNAIPRFTTSPQDHTATLGDDVTLQCQAEGSPRPDITWTHNGDPTSFNVRSRKLANGALSISNVVSADSGDYVCTASNSLQTITSTARLRVLVPPVIIRSPVDISVLRGSNANFTCEASGDTEPVLTWTKDGQPLRNNGRNELRRSGEVLMIFNIVPTDQGSYTCRAENAAGVITATAVLRMVQNEVPSFSESSEVVTAVRGQAVSLRCVATGRPAPLYDWLRGGRVLQDRNRYTVSGGTLTISNVQQHDAGRFDCRAENVAGQATKSIFLQVQGTNNPWPGDRFVHNAIPRARTRVNNAINSTLRELFDRSRSHTVQDLLTAFRYPAPESLNLATAEEIYEQTLELIHEKVNEGHQFDLEDGQEIPISELVSPAHLHIIANMSGCLAQARNIDCSNSCFHRKYRTLDGTCNNFQHPSWGASSTAFERLLPPIYENGFNQPVGWVSHKLYRGTHLPSARLVSSLLMSTDRITNDDQFTHMLMQWGQFVDHDMDLAPQSVSYSRFSDGQHCNETCENTNPCFPIPVPASDPRIQNFQCLGFTRSSATCHTGSTSLFYNTVAPRQQVNALTSFIDASNVYGNTERMSNHLRNLGANRGLMREGPPSSPGTKRHLPFDEEFLHHLDCQIEPSKQHVPCFITGDPRANEHLALTAMHTLFMRQHNHIATKMNRINPHWDGNRIFHETRKIIGAMMQRITYKHWLPKVIGPKGMAMMGPYTGYKPDVNPSIVNEFAVAALRFGHTLVQPVIFRLNETFQEAEGGHLPLHRAFFSPYRLLEEGGIDPLIRGLFGRAAKKRMPGEFFNSELTEKLFKLANALGQDLASLNIQRGRDHGIQFYNDYREHCGMPRANSFEDLRNEIQHRDTRAKLQALYGHPDNIDLFIGGLSESLEEGAKVGPTFLCILAGQFQRLRDGDRLWYERDGVFTPEQLVTIEHTSLASVVCDSSDDIRQVQADVFLRVEEEEEYLSCDRIPRLDVQQWTDCCEDCRTRSTLGSFGGRFRGRRSVDQSYPGDRPEEDYLQGDQPAQPESDRANSPVQSPLLDLPEPAETKQQSDERTVTEDRISQLVQVEEDDMELMENRIESMEDTLMVMHQLITDLKRKVSRLERQGKGKLACRDQRRVPRRNGETWAMDKCTRCQCKRGEVHCRSEGC